MELFTTSYFYIYSSSGATFEFLEQSLKPYERYNIKPKRISNHDILHNNILESHPESILGVILPGTSAGQRYRDDLGPKGSEMIKSYTEQGGAFFGICAGGYLSCHNVKYEGQSTSKELISDLDFFQATAYGQLDLLDKRFASPKGWEQANVTTVSYTNSRNMPDDASVLYWGGGRIVPYEDEIIEPIAYYNSVKNEDGSQAIAIAAKNFGEGRAVFSGVHPEISGVGLEQSRTAKHADAGDSSFRKELVDKLKADEFGRAALFRQMMDEAFKTARGLKHMDMYRAHLEENKHPKNNAQTFLIL